MKIFLTIIVLFVWSEVTAQAKREVFRNNGDVQVEYLTKNPTKSFVKNPDSTFRTRRFWTLEKLDTVAGTLKTIDSIGGETNRSAALGVLAYMRLNIDTITAIGRDTLLGKADTILRKIFIPKTGATLTKYNVFIHN